MKSNPISASAALALLGSLVLAGCKQEVHVEEKKEPTEVAVQVSKIARTTLRAHVEAYGTVEPEPAGGGKPGGAARLAAPVAGVVMAVPVKEGDRVEVGTVIVRLDDRVALAMAEKARTSVTFAEQIVARQTKLKSIDGTSEKVIQEAAQQLASSKAELATAEAQLALVQLRTPLAGTVGRINVAPGQAVDLNTVVAEVVDSSRLVVTASVPASEASALKTGQSVEIFTESNEKPAATVSISFVSPSTDVKTGTVLMRIAVPAEAGLRSGQFVRVRIVGEEHLDRLAVPLASVVTDVEGHSVIAVVEGGKATQKSVKTGIRDGDLVEVEGEGLKEGDTIVTVGAYGLPKETKVRLLKP